MNWKYVPWDLKFLDKEFDTSYKEYKKSRDNIPDLPYQCILDKHKKFINELTHTFLLPPSHNGFDSPYYKFKLYKNGGVSYRDVMKEITLGIN
jgi:hypothetical protein